MTVFFFFKESIVKHFKKKKLFISIRSKTELQRNLIICNCTVIFNIPARTWAIAFRSIVWMSALGQTFDYIKLNMLHSAFVLYCYITNFPHIVQLPWGFLAQSHF